MAKRIIKKKVKKVEKKAKPVKEVVVKSNKKGRKTRVIAKDIESGIEFKDRDYFTPDHCSKIKDVNHARLMAEKDMQLHEQLVKSMNLEIKMMLEVTLRDLKSKLASKHEEYKIADKIANDFAHEMTELYHIVGDIKMIPASGKIIR